MATPKQSTNSSTKATTKPKTTKKKSTASAKPKGKRLSVLLDAETSEMMEAYLGEFGFSKEEFIKKAIVEKISRERISSMIDSMIL